MEYSKIKKSINGHFAIDIKGNDFGNYPGNRFTGVREYKKFVDGTGYKNVVEIKKGKKGGKMSQEYHEAMVVICNHFGVDFDGMELGQKIVIEI